MGPLIYFFVISFWRVLLFKLKPDFTFVNYGQTFDQHSATLAFTLGLAFVVAALTTALGFVYAYLIRFKAGRWGPALLFIALITLFGGYLMKIYSWMTILGITGVLNAALLALGDHRRAVAVALLQCRRRGRCPGRTSCSRSPSCRSTPPCAASPISSWRRRATSARRAWRSFSDIVVPRSHVGTMAGFGLCFLLAAGDYLTPRSSAARST